MAAVGYALAGCVVVMLGLLALVVWEDQHRVEVRHPLDDDVPRWWW